MCFPALRGDARSAFCEVGRKRRMDAEVAGEGDAGRMLAAARTRRGMGAAVLSRCHGNTARTLRLRSGYMII